MSKIPQEHKGRTLGQIIKVWMVDNKVRHYDLADQVGVASSMLSRWSRDEIVPKHRYLLKIRDATGIDLEVLTQAAART